MEGVQIISANHTHNKLIMNTTLTAGDIITVITLDKPMTFLEMAREYLGSTDVEVIKKHTLTPVMMEEMKKSDDTNGMWTDGYANFYFVENSDGSVSVGSVRRDSLEWYRRVIGLAYSFHWVAGSRLLLCNMDTRTVSEPSIPVLSCGHTCGVCLVKESV